jgi:hypothetical protein
VSESNTPLADAIITLIMDSHSTRKISVTSYKRAQKALRALVLPRDDRERILTFLSFHNKEGQPTKWLAEKLAEVKS